ncbi:hypothetical protein scyTo_0006020, partial [Scyliorhinus torazame]|nr:hypothetical protein [Scyliorhinus torazame]
ERKWIEKQNRAARAQRKKEEMNRIRTLVDTAYSCDPRIKKFKEEEKARKESEKKAKVEAKRKEQEEKEKNWNYFTEDQTENVKMMEEVEKLCDRLELMSLQALNEVLASSTRDEGQAEIEKQIQEVNAQLAKEKEESEARMRQAAKSSDHATGYGGGSKTWLEEDLQLLIKGVNIFPAGTNTRWEVIANFINSHSTSGIRRTAKDVINKAKNLQKLDPLQKDEINKKAFEKFNKDHNTAVAALDKATPSERFEAHGCDINPWTAEEQKLLEQALKTYPVNTPERWEKIAATIPGRTKRDCMKRYKELVEMVKAKKAAQDQVNTVRSKK